MTYGTCRRITADAMKELERFGISVELIVVAIATHLIVKGIIDNLAKVNPDYLLR